jgi:hypothetical protein
MRRAPKSASTIPLWWVALNHFNLHNRGRALSRVQPFESFHGRWALSRAQLSNPLMVLLLVLPASATVHNSEHDFWSYLQFSSSPAVSPRANVDAMGHEYP